MNEKLIFNCTWGREDPERATLPFIAANIAAIMSKTGGSCDSTCDFPFRS